MVVHTYLLAILCALAVERWTNIATILRKWRIFHIYLSYASKFFRGLGVKNETLCFAMVLIIAVVIVALINIALSILQYALNLYQLLTFLFAFLIVLYCLGSNFYGTKEERTLDDSVEGSCARANNYLFAIVFWAALLHPAGAVLYRLSDYMVEEDYDFGWKSTATVWMQLLDWLPMRLFALGFAFVGNFNAAITIWLDRLVGGLASSLSLLTRCAEAVLKASSGRGKEEERKSAQEIGPVLYRLFDRIIILWLVVIIILALL